MFSSVIRPCNNPLASTPLIGIDLGLSSRDGDRRALLISAADIERVRAETPLSIKSPLEEKIWPSNSPTAPRARASSNSCLSTMPVDRIEASIVDRADADQAQGRLHAKLEHVRDAALLEQNFAILRRVG